MYGRINRDNIHPKAPDPRALKRESNAYLANRHVFDMLARALKRGEITHQEYTTLRGQVKAGDADGAVKGLGRILMRG